ncbi:hypothetical protein OSTOST_06471 [Ostertagia ostertagi]
MLSLLRLVSSALLAAPLLASAAPPEAATEHVKARLVSSQATVAPGQRFTVAFEQTIKSHWHTYWLNPGDSGQATTIDWTGTQAGPIQWPTPSVQAIGPIKGSFVATKDYARLARRLPALLAPGGLALLCLNTPKLGLDFLRGVMAEHAPELAFVARVANPAAFGDASQDRGLKVLAYAAPQDAAAR